MSGFRFKSFVNFEEWAADQPGDVNLTHTTNGSVFLMVRGEVVAHVKKELRGSTAEETLQNLAGINLTIGIPPADPETQEVGLPTLMEDKSQWDTIKLR